MGNVRITITDVLQCRRMPFSCEDCSQTLGMDQTDFIRLFSPNAVSFSVCAFHSRASQPKSKK